MRQTRTLAALCVLWLCACPSDAFAFGAIINAIATGAGAVGTFFASGTVAAGLIKSIGGIIVSVGLSFVASLIFRPPVPKPSDGQLESKQAIPPRQFHYGRLKVSGPLLFYESRKVDPGNDFPALWKIIAISAREIDAVEAIYLDAKAVTLDTNDDVTEEQYTTGEGNPIVNINIYYGTDDQLADELLMEIFPDEWTEDHRLQGIAYLRCKFQGTSAERYNGRYPNGEPTVTVDIRGSKVFDPRDSGQDIDDKLTWQWSDNAALCVLDYLLHTDGYDRPVAKIDIASFAAYADLCDELVPLKSLGSDGSGGSDGEAFEARYRVATTVFLDEPRKDVLQRLLEACDGRLYPLSDGQIAIRGGQWINPEVTLDADQGHLIEARFSQGVDALNRYNELAIQFLSPAHDYTEVEGDPWRDEDAIVADGGEVKTQQLNLFQVPSHGQARRLAKIRMARDNPDWIGEIRTNYVGLDCIGEETVDLMWSELDGDGSDSGGFNGPFWIDRELALTADGTGMSIPVRSADPASYDWDAETEEGIAPVIPPDTGPEFNPLEAPISPIALSIDDSVPGQASIHWTNPNSPAPIFTAARVWRGGPAAVFSAAVDISGPIYSAPSQAIIYVDVVAAGSYRWWVTAENGEGTLSIETGPAPGTVT